MRSFLVLVAFATSTLAVYIQSMNIRRYTESTESIVASLAASNHYGAPSPPPSSGSGGWYFGDDPGSADDIPWLKDEDLCATLSQHPECLQCPLAGTLTLPTTIIYARRPSPASTPTQPSRPSPTASYSHIFSGLDTAIESSDYLTYGLVDTVSDCETMCDSVLGCIYINTYYVVPNGKDGSPLLTCSLYPEYLTVFQANITQPDGSVAFIKDSAGYLKESQNMLPFGI